MALRHVPERTCVGCRIEQPKRAMVRVVRTSLGQVMVDPTGKQAGRGAYLCRRPACWQAGLRKDALARALKTTVSAEDRRALEAYAASLPRDSVGAASEGPLAKGVQYESKAI